MDQDHPLRERYERRLAELKDDLKAFDDLGMRTWHESLREPRHETTERSRQMLCDVIEDYERILAGERIQP